ncbi:hypothetical protein JCM11491_003022 [Sporobolomyces phaffii]
MLDDPRKVLQAYARMQNALPTREQFQALVEQHVDEFNHDIDLLHHHLFVLGHYALETTHQEHHSDAIDRKLVDGARQAFELDRLLLTEHHFKQLVRHLEDGPAQNRTARNLLHALDSARLQVNRVVAADGHDHTCQTRIDWGCKGCYEHGEHLYETRNNGLHDEVLKLGLYRIDGRDNDKTWTSKYYFAAFAPRLVDMRARLRRDSAPDALPRRMRRTVAILDRLDEAFERFHPRSLAEASALFTDTVTFYSDPAKFGKDQVNAVLEQIELFRDEAREGEHGHHEGRTSGLPVPDLRSPSHKAVLDSVHELHDTPANWMPHVSEWLDRASPPLVGPSRPNSAPPNIESRPASPTPPLDDHSRPASPTLRASSPRPGRRGSSPPRLGDRLRLLVTRTRSRSPPPSRPSSPPRTATSKPSTVAQLRRGLDAFLHKHPQQPGDGDAHVSTYSRSTSPTRPRGPVEEEDRGRPPLVLARNLYAGSVVSTATTAHSPARRPRGRSASIHRRVVVESGQP